MGKGATSMHPSVVITKHGQCRELYIAARVRRCIDAVMAAEGMIAFHWCEFSDAWMETAQVWRNVQVLSRWPPDPQTAQNGLVLRNAELAVIGGHER